MNNDDFLELFDLFVNWPARIAKEGPFVEKLLREAGARTVLDAGCGPGHHSVFLARKGFDVYAADNAACMVEQTGKQAQAAGVPVKALQCSFEDVQKALRGTMDAVIVLGNSLCMVQDREAARRAMKGLAESLRPGGLMLLHVLNYAGLRINGKRVSRPHQIDGDALVLKFFDLDPGFVRVNIVRLSPEKPGLWKSEHTFAPLLDLSKEELETMATEEGFERFSFFGNAEGKPYDPGKAYDLFVLCHKK